MAQSIGIRQNAVQRIISGCKVPFDPRTTEQVCTTRDPENYKAKERLFRKMQWARASKGKTRSAGFLGPINTYPE